MIHTTIGLYADGSFKMNGVKPEHLTDHIEYNKTHRFGRALFVDGKCEYGGCLSDEQTRNFEKHINLENLKADKCTAPYE